MSTKKDILYTLNDSGDKLEPMVPVTITDNVLLDVNQTTTLTDKLTEIERIGLNKSIQRPEIIPNGADLNNYKSPGFFWTHSNAQVTEIKNRPPSLGNNVFTLVVFATSGCIQLLISYRSHGTVAYLRSYTTDSWSDWKYMIDEKNLYLHSVKRYKNLNIDYLKNHKFDVAYRTYVNNTVGRELGLTTMPNSMIGIDYTPYGSENDGHGLQIAHNLNRGDQANTENYWLMKIRTSDSSGWKDWQEVPIYGNYLNDVHKINDFNKALGVLKVKCGAMNSIANSPMSHVSGYVLPLFFDASNGVQLYMSHSSDTVWVRRMDSSVWKPWHRIWGYADIELKDNQVHIKKPLKVDFDINMTGHKKIVTRSIVGTQDGVDGSIFLNYDTGKPVYIKYKGRDLSVQSIMEKAEANENKLNTNKNFTIQQLNNINNTEVFETETSLIKELGLSKNTGKAIIKGFKGFQIAYNIENKDFGTVDFWTMKMRTVEGGSWGPWREVLTAIGDINNGDDARQDINVRDLNDVRGLLRVRSVGLSGILNHPIGGSENGYVLPLFAQNNDDGVQLYFTHNSDVIYIRRFVDKVWKPWYKIWDLAVMNIGDNKLNIRKNTDVDGDFDFHGSKRINTRVINGAIRGASDRDLFLNYHNPTAKVYFKYNNNNVSFQDAYKELEEKRFLYFGKAGKTGNIPTITKEILEDGRYKYPYVASIIWGTEIGLPHTDAQIVYYPNRLTNMTGYGFQQAFIQDNNGRMEMYIRRSNNATPVVWEPWQRIFQDRDFDERFIAKNKSHSIHNFGKVTTADVNIINNHKIPYSYTINFKNSSAIGLTPSNVNEWVTVQYHTFSSDGYGIQTAFNNLLTSRNTENIWIMKIRLSNASGWTPWYEVNAFHSGVNNNTNGRNMFNTTDFNNVRGMLNVRCGIYPTATANSPLHPLGADDGYVIPLFFQNDQWGVQLVVSHHKDIMFHRRLRDRTWTPWKRIWDDSILSIESNKIIARKPLEINEIKSFNQRALFLDSTQGSIHYKFEDGGTINMSEVAYNSIYSIRTHYTGRRGFRKLTMEEFNNPHHPTFYRASIDYGKQYKLPFNEAFIDYYPFSRNGDNTSQNNISVSMQVAQSFENKHYLRYVRFSENGSWGPWHGEYDSEVFYLGRAFVNIGKRLNLKDPHILSSEALELNTTNDSEVLIKAWNGQKVSLQSIEQDIRLLDPIPTLETKRVDASIMNNSNYPKFYIGDMSSEEASKVGLGGWNHIMYFRHYNNNGYGSQIAINLNGDKYSHEKHWEMKVRTSRGNQWEPWATVLTTIDGMDNNFGLYGRATTMDYNAVRGTGKIVAGIWQQTGNRPVTNDDGYVLPMFLKNQTYGVQIYFSHNYECIYYRRMVNGTFQHWHKAYDRGIMDIRETGIHMMNNKVIYTRHIEGTSENFDGDLYLNHNNRRAVRIASPSGGDINISEWTDHIRVVNGQLEIKVGGSWIRGGGMQYTVKHKISLERQHQGTATWSLNRGPGVLRYIKVRIPNRNNYLPSYFNIITDGTNVIDNGFINSESFGNDNNIIERLFTLNIEYKNSISINLSSGSTGVDKIEGLVQTVS